MSSCMDDRGTWNAAEKPLDKQEEVGWGHGEELTWQRGHVDGFNRCDYTLDVEELGD